MTMQQKIYSDLNSGKLTEKNYLINLKKIEIKDKEFYIRKLQNQTGKDILVRKQKKELKKLKEELKTLKSA